MTGLGSPPMYSTRMGSVVSRWFTDYDEARASLAAEGGYLLPFNEQYFVTAREGIRELGLDPDDADWARIGFDWVRPADVDAWERLAVRRSIAAGA